MRGAISGDGSWAFARRAWLVLLLSVGSTAWAQNVTVNPGAGSYATLADAFTAINAGTHTGALTVSIVGDTTEPAAGAILNASGSGAASYTSIAITPTGARTISGAATAGSPLIDLNGADNVTIDGLNSSGNSLTIANTTVSNTSGTSTIRFIGGATSNTITNANIQGSGTMSVANNGAVIFFSTDAVTANGNDNNTISNNNIGPAGANLPTKGILCNGSASTAAIGNSGNIVNNNNVFDFFGAAVTSSGIASNGGCSAWTITNNRLYQTATRTWTTGSLHVGIDIRPATATSGAQGFTITGNTIGFASNTQTGTYTLTGTGTGAKFIGILFNGISTGAATTINNNTVAGVSMTGVTGSGTSTSSPFTGILFQEGNGTTNGNTIGSLSASNSLVFSTTTTSATDVYGIYNFSSNAWTSNNNNIGGLSVTNLGASGTFLVWGMRANTGSAVTWTATGNTIGGTPANSIQLSATGTASQLVGLFTGNAPAVLTANTVRNLTSNIGTGTTSSASVIGINITATTPSHTVSRNIISTLTNTNGSAASVVTGIQFTGSTANIVERNLIYDLRAATNSASGEVNGIRVAGGTTNYRNNMIALGANVANALGAAATNSSTAGINGINGALGTDSFFHNSVYIGGTATAGTGASFAFNGTQTVNTRSVRNNIFFNARTNAGATGKHYAVKINGTTPNPTGLTINNNVYFANGTGGVFGFFNSADVANIAAWRVAVGQDSGSFESNPQFNDPTNAVPDLHLHPTNPTVAESNGTDVGVIDDFDGQVRSGLTPVDIGADAGNFNGIDLAGPAISYSAFANTLLTSDRTLAVTITDITGVATGGLAPRIYYRKNAGAYFSQACALASGTVNNGNWDCTVNNTDMGGVVASDQIGYFVIAQDTPGNVSSNPAGAIAANVNTVTTPPTPNSYLISPPISGIRTVCAAGCDFTSLTGAAGVFRAINDSVVTGNVEIQIAGDLVEDGTNGLNALVEQPAASNFTVRMYPTGAPRSITGAFNGALIRMRGSSRVTIDGSLGGVGTDRSLTITNTSVTTPSVILFGSIGTAPITGNTLKNCVVINGVNTSSAILISDATTVGNAGFFSNITIQNNDVQRAFVGVFANGGSTPQNGSNLVYTQNKLDTTGANAIRNVGLYMQGVSGATVSQNTVGNFSNGEGENDTGIWLATGTGNATVSGNTVTNLGMTLTSAFAPIGIRESSGLAASGNNIAGNTITNLSTTGGFNLRGIATSSTGITIQGNRIQGILNNSTGTFGAFGIDVTAGNDLVIRNNFVSDVNHNMSGGAAFTPDFGVIGIRLGAGTGHRVYHNSVNLFGPHPGTATTSLLSAAFSISSTSQTGIDVRNNIFANNITGGTTSIAHVSVFLPSGGTSAMNLTWNNNAYYFGTDAARQGVAQVGTTAGTTFFTTLPALTAYTSTLSASGNNDNASIAATSAVPFVSATDLHLSAPLPVQGVPIASVLTDIDGDPRSATAPDIGADELPRGNLTITPSAVNFGNQLVGTTSAGFTVTLGNNGAASLIVDPLTAAAAPFARSGGTCSAPPITIAAGANCTVIYTFSPTATGPAAQNLTVTSSGSGSGTIALSGVGIQGNLVIAGSPVAFGSQLVGTTSAAQTVTLSNTGTASLQVTALTAATAPFARDGGTCSSVPITIAAGTECTLTYTFAPAAIGPANQLLTVTADAPGSGTIELSGTGVQGNLTIAPNAVNFGDQDVGTTSAEQTVTLGNNGTAPLNVTTLTAASAPFARTNTGTCSAVPITINPGSTCTLTYTFAPTATGAANQSLTVTSSGTGSGTIALSGTGVQGNLTITPSAVNFGNQDVGTTSAEQTVTLGNNGTAALNVTALTAATAPFARTNSGTCSAVPITINPGTSCTLTYTFAPTVSGAANQSLTVTSSGTGSGSIALSGNGVAGAFSVTPNPVAFGNQLVGTSSATQTVTLSNTGTGSLQVTALPAPTAPFVRSGGTCGATPFTLTPSGTCTAIYRFDPTAAGAASQNIAIESIPGGTTTLVLNGTGVQGNLAITGSPVNFGNQLLGTTSAAQTVTLSNTGTASLDVTALTAAAAPFARAGGSCSNVPITIAAGTNCTLTYTFAPTALGAANQSLTVTADSPGSGTIELSGTGVQGNLTIAPNAVNFGDQAVGTTSAEQTVTLGNNGTAPLNVTTLTAASAPFARTNTGTCSAVPITINPGSTCTLTYTFAPTATGAANQSLTVTSSGTGSGTIALSGTGVQGNLTITPSAVNFGNQDVGTTSAEQTVTLGNNGTAALNVTALTAATAPFARTNSGTCSAVPITINPGTSCTLTYTFAPTVSGAANQSLTVTSSGTGSGSIALSGNGVAGAFSVAPNPVAFGDQLIGSQSSTQTVTFSNTGSGSLQVTALPAPTPPFVRTGGSCAAPPFTLNATQSCTAVYRFDPTVSGPVSQNLDIVTSPGGTTSLVLTGTGVQGFLTIIPSTVEFGNEPVGTTSTPQTVTLGNSGDASLAVTVLTAAVGPFSRTGGTCALAPPITLAPEASCTLIYRFAPTATGAVGQVLTVTADAPGSGTITLNGTGTPAADLSISKTSNVSLIEFGLMQYTLVVSNTGPSPVTSAVVVDNFASSLTNVAWSCVGVSGGTCAGNGAGNINRMVDLPVGASVVYSISATVVQPLPATISNTATVAAPSGVTEINTANNTSTVVNSTALFSNGFEAASVIANAVALPSRVGVLSSLVIAPDRTQQAAAAPMPGDVALYSVDGYLIAIQARRVGSQVQVRMLIADARRNWQVGDWSTVDASRGLRLEWLSRPAANGGVEVVAQLSNP